MGLKLIYFVKLFLIVTLSAIFLAFVNIAFDLPLLLLAVSAACFILIRLLWVSALKDEKAIKRQTCPGKTGRAVGEISPDFKRAA